MKKQLLLLFLALLISVATSADLVLINRIYYGLNSQTMEAEVSEIHSINGKHSVSIPSEVTYNGKTYSVTSIGERAFYKCSSLTSITIPNSVTSIVYSAFENCTGLTSVTLGNSVTNIGDNAFDGCSALTSVTIPNSVTNIGNYAFNGCSGLTSVTLGNSVTNIGNYAFYGCSGLTSLDIPNSVTSIGNEAFRGCSGLTSITIPNSVASIGSSAFSGCSDLTSITVETGNANYDSRDNCNAIIKTTTNTLIAGCMNTVIPNSVTDIDDKTFYGCSNITDVYCYARKVPTTGHDVFKDSNILSATLHVPAVAIELYKMLSHGVYSWKLLP